MLAAKVFWRRLSVPKSGTIQPRPARRSRLSTTPVVCRSAMPNKTSRVRHVRIAEPLYRGRRLRLPVGGGTEIMVGSSQIVRGLLMRPSYHAGFT
jgi:hypothetical protein